MDTLQLALNEVRRQISQIQPYLGKLREVETELSALLASRHDVVRELMVNGEVDSLPSVPSSATIFPSHKPTDHPSIPNTIIATLNTAQRVMGLAEIDREVRKIHKDMHKNAVSSNVSRLVKDKRIKRIGPGAYASLGTVIYRPSIKRPASRHDSIPAIAQHILGEAGKPLTIDDIWPMAKAVNPDMKKHSLVGSLYANAKKNRIFILMDQKTFGLREWESSQREKQDPSDDVEMSLAMETMPEEIEEGKMLEGEYHLVHQTE